MLLYFNMNYWRIINCVPFCHIFISSYCLLYSDLSFNNIEVIEGLDKLTQLEDLTLFNNRIQQLENMDTLTKLHVLSVGNNDLKELDNVSWLLFSLICQLWMVNYGIAKFKLHLNAKYVSFSFFSLEWKLKLNLDIMQSCDRAFGICTQLYRDMPIVIQPSQCEYALIYSLYV